jgi:branched-chain amino acid transport system ATP-binding protein
LENANGIQPDGGPPDGALLRVEGLEVSYGELQVLWGVDLAVRRGEVVCILGPNGAGKSTVLNTVSGLIRSQRGTIDFDGERIDGLPTHRIVRRGLAHVLERRRVFPYLSVRSNLDLGAYNPAARPHRSVAREWVYGLFPILAQRQNQLAGTMSGGEQQQLAIARGLMSRPKLLLIDEPFLGLSPQMVEEILRVIQRINREGVSVLFIEQDVHLALSVCDRGYVLESGRVALTGTGRELLANEELRTVYLGI